MVYSTERSTGVTIFLLLINLVLIGMGIFFLFMNQQWIIFILCILFAAYNDWVLLDIKYTFNNDKLFVKAGPIRRYIYYRDILKVEKTTDSLTGTRLTGSTKSIEIFYKDNGKYKSIKISPKLRNEFLEELLSKNQNINISESCRL